MRFKSVHDKKRENPVFSTDCRTPQDLLEQWQRLCKIYLPVLSDDSLWRYSRRLTSGDKEQGWKLHLSATILSANEVLEKAAPLLCDANALFKAPVSLLELGKLNSGIYYGYSQIGKFITVYPQSDQEALYLAEKLHRLTSRLPAPLIPFDHQYRFGSSIFYRYGAFKRLEIKNPDGATTLAIRNPEGNLIPDIRDTENAEPDWISNPFPPLKPVKTRTQNPLRTTYKVFRALTQRGKGGVFHAVDLSCQSPRLCIIKEGRKNGEVDWYGCDGYYYVKREAEVLKALQSAGAPAVYSSFELEGNFYLVTEYIEGESLDKFLFKRKRRLPIKRALEFGIKLSEVLTQIHTAGWVWADCKPSNVILTTDNNLRPVDFEGAGLIGEPTLAIAGTPGFMAPERKGHFRHKFAVSQDLYSLGAFIYFLLVGQDYSVENPAPLKKLRRRSSPRVQEIITKLLAANPRERPGAQTVGRELNIELEFMTAAGA